MDNASLPKVLTGPNVWCDVTASYRPASAFHTHECCCSGCRRMQTMLLVKPSHVTCTWLSEMAPEHPLPMTIRLCGGTDCQPPTRCSEPYHVIPPLVQCVMALVRYSSGTQSSSLPTAHPSAGATKHTLFMLPVDPARLCYGLALPNGCAGVDRDMMKGVPLCAGKQQYSG